VIEEDADSCPDTLVFLRPLCTMEDRVEGLKCK
jgi:hypothetical protein